MVNTDYKSLEPTNIENINFDSGSSKDVIFNQLYKYLYGFCDKNYIISLINEYNVKGYSGFCTNKWLEETVAIKCYDCEYDGTCAICLDCFFDSDHTGHEYRLTKTSGGCCDCGDVSSWDVKGSCSVHTNGTIIDEKCTLDLFTNSFLMRLETLIRHIVTNVSYYLHNINAVNGETLQILVLFLNDLANVTPAYRYSLSLCLSREVLKDWMLRHQILPNDLQKSFNSFYLTMITSMSFKKKFSSLFAELYVDIVQPLKEIQDDWHLSNLSVQLFTYSNIAFELLKNQFMEICIDPIVDKAPIDKRLNTLQFARFDRKKFNLYIRIISDLTYLMNHTVVCRLLLSDERLQTTVFNLFFVHNYMNLIERHTRTHVQYENTGYSIAFTVEHSLHSAFKPLSDYIKSLGDTDLPMVLKLYKNFNDFIKKNALNVKFNSNMLTRSFHIPLVRLFTSVVDFNVVRRYAKYHLTLMAMTDERVAEYLNKSFLHLKSNESLQFDLLELFDNDVLKYVLRSTIDVLKFAMEIKHNLWVFNGESLRDQRTTYYELLFDSFDIASIQMAVVLLGMKNFRSDFDVLTYIFEICFDLKHYESSPYKSAVERYRNGAAAKTGAEETSLNEIYNVVENLISDVQGRITTSREQERGEDNREEDMSSSIDHNNISEGESFEIQFEEYPACKSDPGTFDFKINFFYILLNTLVNDIKHLEILSISRKTTKEWFVNRGYPLLLMDIVNSLASGNVEFGQIVNETKKHWKHHPMFIETIERVAMFNYSKVSDKTYIRLKQESYKLIDVVWNTLQPATHAISSQCLNHDISLLGPFEGEIMSPEYRETQALILNSISCNMLFNYLLLPLVYESKMEFKLEKKDFESLPDLYKTALESSKESNFKKFELASNMLACSNYKFKRSSHVLLYSLKMLNLLYSKLTPAHENIGFVMVSMLKLILSRMDDEVYKKCINYTLNRLNKVYNFKSKPENKSKQIEKKDVKKIQKKFLNKIFKQQELFKIDTEDMEQMEEGDTEESILCILCKQKMESESEMSCLCFISSNNVLRRCSSSNGLSNDRRTNYGVYAKSSIPLKSSIISSCGHVAHTRCINEHRNMQEDVENFSIYGIHRASTEFLCPMCKTLCNYTLNMIPDSKIQKYAPEDHLVPYLAAISKNKDNIGNEHEDSLNVWANILMDKFDSIDDSLESSNSIYNIYDLCKSSWRYPYSNLWLPCPVYAMNEKHGKYVYAMSVISSNKNINYYLNTDSKSRVDELSLGSTAPLKNIECSYCANFDFDLSNLNSYKCEAFKMKEKYTLPPIRVFDKENAHMMQSVYRYFVENWEVVKSNKVYSLINLRGSELDYTEKFSRALLTPYSRALFSDKRAYFGIRNWRHVNSTVEVDPKVWVLYNEMLSTSSVRRNMLNTPNAFYSQLLRNFYFTGMMPNSNEDDYEFDNVYTKNVLLDKSYYDYDDTKMVMPDLSLYKDKMLEKETDMIRVFVESLNEVTLLQMYKMIRRDEEKKKDDTYYVESTTENDFIQRLMKRRYEISRINSLLPLNHYISYQGKMSANKIFGNDMVLNPWSFDYIREFLKVFLSQKNYVKSVITHYVYFFTVVASLQVMDRFIVDVMRINYRRFIENYSDGDERLYRTRLKIEFMTAFNQKFFSDLFANAEFPCDVVPRIAFTDFEENLNEYRSYNMMLGHICDSRRQRSKSKYTKDSIYYEQLDDMISDMVEYSGMLKSVHDKHVEALTEPIPYDQILHDRVNTYITDELLERHLFNQVSRILKAREIQNSLNNKYDFEAIAYGLEEVFEQAVYPKRQRLHDGKIDTTDESPSSILKIESASTPITTNSAHNMYRGVDLARRLNGLLYKNHSNTVFFETIRHNIPQSPHILDFLTPELASGISNLKVDVSTSFLSVIEKVFNFTVRHFIQMGYINYEPERLMFEKYKEQLFESLNIFLDVAFWALNSMFKYEDEVCSKVLYGHLNSEATRFNLLIEALGIGAKSILMKPSEILRNMFSETYKSQMQLNRNCNMEVTPPILSKYSLIDVERHLTELHWDMIRNTALRSCANCGLKPANPLMCLLCGSLVCSNNECCHKVQTAQDTRFLVHVEKKLRRLKKGELMSIYDEELVAHAKVCGGGQCIYFSPYHCCVLLVEERRRATVASIYSDQYGNSDLHGKVYGDVKLARVRLENIVNTFCSGRLSNEIVTQRKQLINLLA
ncbi:uncharacterized protein TOT_040000399 [Theileria orientalis strain Shintoku]|uniref:E3 ubiquitin-protein ligase n=1 Tax=Theileria orientalis strain Shintoku TaxID=869250 RepID=J4C970_THEOR|nr:uncharacterized protein TOT_040000399 [Theileria orientalis strain Shintoku]BAM42023.1 uncharacterized protein TOT_040000399 [Theileria orientalis strain Shintoku]|eukprot:XP_009692324.1 uncharacterized protein TOT_040000399 [Theileria orientalis strain Shintoku]